MWVSATSAETAKAMDDVHVSASEKQFEENKKRFEANEKAIKTNTQSLIALVGKVDTIAVASMATEDTASDNKVMLIRVEERQVFIIKTLQKLSPN